MYIGRSSGIITVFSIVKDLPQRNVYMPKVRVTLVWWCSSIGGHIAGIPVPQKQEPLVHICPKILQWAWIIGSRMRWFCLPGVESTLGSWHSGFMGDSLEITNHPLTRLFVCFLILSAYSLHGWPRGGHQPVCPGIPKPAMGSDFFDNWTSKPVNKALTNDIKCAESPVTRNSRPHRSIYLGPQPKTSALQVGGSGLWFASQHWWTSWPAREEGPREQTRSVGDQTIRKG